MSRYVCPSASGGKFWEISLEGKSTKVTFGKVNTPGQSRTKQFPTREAAETEVAKLIKQKTSKGYVLASNTSSTKKKSSSTSSSSSKRKVPQVSDDEDEEEAGGGDDDDIGPQRFVCETKFWQIEVRNKSTIVSYGKVTSAGVQKTKVFASAAAAKKEMVKLIAQKKKKGYVPDGDGGEALPNGENDRRHLAHVIEFLDNSANEPPSAANTKFGGSPVWLTEPAWPRSPSLNKPMKFLGQILLTVDLFPHLVQANMDTVLYVFISANVDDNDDVDGTWEADGGENRVIIQEAKRSTKKKKRKMDPQPETAEIGNIMLKEMIGEYTVKWEDVDEKGQLINPPDWFETKLGGVPMFLQNDEYPTANKEEWTLIWQFGSNLHMMGDCGVGYVFMKNDRSEAKYLWQCS